MNDNMQDILKNYYASGGKTLFESAEQSDSTIPDRARKIIATYSRQSGFKSPVKPDIAAISGTPEEDLLAEIESQLVKSYTSDSKVDYSYVNKAWRLHVMNLKMSIPSRHMLKRIPMPKMNQNFINNLAKQDATRYLTMYLQDTDLDHPVLGDHPVLDHPVKAKTGFDGRQRSSVKAKKLSDLVLNQPLKAKAKKLSKLSDLVLKKPF